MKAGPKLDQTCPDCGTTEAAGRYCTKCLVSISAEHIHPRKRSAAQRAATDAARASGLKKSAQRAVA
jgi:hypothetical protein